MVPPDSTRVSRARAYSGIPLANFNFRVRGSHPLRRPFPWASTNIHCAVMWLLQPRPRNLERFGLVRVRSPLLAEYQLISFPTGT